MIRKHEAALKRTARRYSICAEDAEDAYQRALEIALTKGPTDRPSELIRWTQTVTKHEALAIRRNRERLLAARPAPAREDDGVDWLALIPAPGAEPGSETERREAIAQSREALRTLKPQELRALTLLAEGYSYAEISEITGYSATKVNRCLAEGRERLRSFMARAEAGERCREIAPLLSAFCDRELDGPDADIVREHLRACAGCRAALRSYRAAPRAAASLAPGLLVPRSIGERLADALNWLQSRLPGGGGGGSLAQAAGAGGAPGAGLTAVAKAIAVCGTAVGGTAACMAAGIVPSPLDLEGAHERPARVERVAKSVAAPRRVAAPSAGEIGEPRGGDRGRRSRARRQDGQAEASAALPSPQADAVAYEPPRAEPAAPPEPEPQSAPEPAPAPAPEPSPEPAAAPSGGGSAAGEFGP
jgi:RNA polymerase sigma factor (sigma-70 family)